MDNLPVPVEPEDDNYHRFVAVYDNKRLAQTRKNQQRSTNAVHDAYDLIGGVPRLAAWADKNPGEFFTKIWARTIQSAQQVEHSGEITIRSAVPRTAIDGEYTDVTPNDV